MIAVLGQTLTFSVNTFSASGPPVDADAAPTYSIYEQEGTTAVLSGTMSKLDDVGTTGLYAETVTIAASGGFERFKTYTVYITAAVSTVAVAKSYNFMAMSEESAIPGGQENAEVLAVVNARLGRANNPLTDITVPLRAALKRLSAIANFLANAEDAAITSSSTYIPYPTDFKALKSILLDGSREEPLALTGYWDIQTIGANDAANEPESYAPFNRRFYLKPLPDGDYTATISYWRYHPNDISTILFEDEFMPAIFDLTTAYAADDLTWPEEALRWEAKYREKVVELLPAEETTVTVVAYNDI